METEVIVTDFIDAAGIRHTGRQILTLDADGNLLCIEPCREEDK